MTETPHEKCPVCFSSAPQKYTHPEAALHRCTECDHCFSNLASMADQEVYSPEYYLEEHRNWFENPNFRLFDQIGARISGQSKTASVLDVGCGKGNLLKRIRDKKPGCDLWGIDLSHNEPEPGITFLQEDIYATSVSRKFDAVVSLAVIEHVGDVRHFLGILKDFVRPGGEVFVMTLNDRSALYTSSRIASKLGLSSPFERLYSKHHVNHFNRSSLHRLGEVAGFEVTAHWDHNIPMAAVDFDASGAVQKAIFSMGVRLCFLFGKLTRTSYLQTIVLRRPAE